MSEGMFKKGIGKIKSFKETEKINFIDMINEAKKEFPLETFEYKQPHNLTLAQYKARYDEMAHEILEIVAWRLRWFGCREQEAHPCK